ncbi:endonuclease/exonuclease/phosphatase family protein [Roseovarius aestuarii]|uniref:Endonuclease/Exonuclease/phosphatase family protein n=1 Tax=Roseovarius aestuarii TaxID=475083 RepID=A0A1X7BSI8_9RHOB|nr:endonuclease/exonuclease/phosphatase family protein [Roseovarius aestuarii]SMC12573.1 Endonuclease/Exonuclease/phosphatase family protein [Roseovarius aestuarii]
MRIATYNVEWFNALFDPDGNPLDDGEWSRRHDVTRSDQLAALGIVFNAIDADAVMIIEAPDHNGSQATTKALENFARLMGLRANRALVGFENDTQQEIALLYDPAMLTARHDPVGTETGKKGSRDAPRFDGVFRIDLDIDNTEDLVTFSKPPFEVAVTTAKGTELRLIGAHLKSKAPHGARSRDEIMRKAIANRRKQQAQAVWLRQRIEAHLEVDEHLIVLGDMNDGPGLDEYENLFGHSSVEIIMGEGAAPGMCLFDPHARRALQRRIGAINTTSRFYLSSEKRYIQALLDYIMVSPGLRDKAPVWRIWHPFDDPNCWKMPELRDALITASDHFPVTIDLDI